MDRITELHAAFLVKTENTKQLKSLKQTISEELEGMPSYPIGAGLIVPTEGYDKENIEKVLKDWLSEHGNDL